MLVDCVLVLRFIDGKNWDTLILKELFFLKCLENSLGFNNCSVKVKVLVSHVWLFEIPWSVAHQLPLSTEFSRQEYWSGLPFPSPVHACMHAKLLQSCPTLCNPMDSCPPGSSIHRILQARVLEWTAIIFSVYFHVEYHNLLLKKILYC